MDAMKRTTGGKKALAFVMERTKSVIAKGWFGERETERVKCLAKSVGEPHFRFWPEAEKWATSS
jgi:hypothetical protein